MFCKKVSLRNLAKLTGNNTYARVSEFLTPSQVFRVHKNAMKNCCDLKYAYFTAQKMKFSIKHFFSKCDQIRRKLQIWSQILKKSLIENFIFLCNNSYLLLSITVCNFQSIKCLVELYSFLSKLFCYITWLVISPD